MKDCDQSNSLQIKSNIENKPKKNEFIGKL